MPEKPCLHCIITDAQEAWLQAGHGSVNEAIEQTLDALTHLVAAVLGRDVRRRMVKEILADIPPRVRQRVQERITNGFPTEVGQGVGHA